jgi:hypothetical protein
VFINENPANEMKIVHADEKMGFLLEVTLTAVIFVKN